LINFERAIPLGLKLVTRLLPSAEHQVTNREGPVFDVAVVVTPNALEVLCVSGALCQLTLLDQHYLIFSSGV
jgi:hypothetical protein